MSRGLRLLSMALVCALVTGCASPQNRRLRRFEATLARHDSATEALEQWCAANRLGAGARVSATVVPMPAPAEPAGTRDLLGVGAGDPLAFRHVRLSCGEAVLSVADNWYVPARLTAAMNHTLDATHTPFGKVAAPLGFRRERLGTVPPDAAGCPPGTILAHRARLRLPDGRPLALLLECYTAANLGG